MTYSGFLAIFLTFLPLGIFSTRLLHKLKWHTFSKKYIEWTNDNYGAFVIMYFAGILFCMGELLK